MSGERGWKRVCCAIEGIVFTVIAPYFTRFELKTGQKCCVFCYENNLTVPLKMIIILFKFALSCMNDHITPMFFKVPPNVGPLMKTLGQYGHSYTPSKFEWYIKTEGFEFHCNSIKPGVIANKKLRFGPRKRLDLLVGQCISVLLKVRNEK